MDTYSINDVLSEIEAGNATSTLDIIKTEMENQVSISILSTLWLESSVINLSLELIRRAISDCNEAIELDENNLLAYFVLGVCYLWKNDEKNALLIWTKGISRPGSIITHKVISSLIENCAIREHVRNMKFDVKALFELHDYFDSSSINSAYGINLALKYLEMKNYPKAIIYFKE